MSRMTRRTAPESPTKRGWLALAPLAVVALLLAVPNVGATSVGPRYHSSCLGPRSGSSLTWDGIFYGPTWSPNGSTGQIALGLAGSRTNATHFAPFLTTLGWFMVGPGP